MRTLFNIISLATLFLLAGCQPKSALLAFYIVSEDKIDGGQFINTMDFPKLGYISAIPDLSVTQLQSVATSTNSTTMVDENGKISTEPVITILMRPDDAKFFSSLTQKAIGKRLLIMLNKTPLIAPRVLMPIKSGNMGLTLSQKGQDKIENELKQLVR